MTTIIYCKKHVKAAQMNNIVLYHPFQCEFFFLQNQEGEGEFQGGKNDIVNFQFPKPPGEFDGRIRYVKYQKIYSQKYFIIIH